MPLSQELLDSSCLASIPSFLTPSPASPSRAPLGGPRRNPFTCSQAFSPQVPVLGLDAPTPLLPTDPRLGARAFLQANWRGSIFHPAPGPPYCTWATLHSRALDSHLLGLCLCLRASVTLAEPFAGPQGTPPQACPAARLPGRVELYHAHDTGQLLFFIMMKHL